MSLYVLGLRKGPSIRYIRNLWGDGGGSSKLRTASYRERRMPRLMRTYALTLSLFMFWQHSCWSCSHEIMEKWNTRLSPETEDTSCLTNCQKIRILSSQWLNYSWTREFELATRGFELGTHGFELGTRGFELVTRKVDLVTHEFKIVDLNS